MRRREFVGLVGGAAAWPLAARAQQPRRIGVLMNGAVTDQQLQSYFTTFVQALRQLGWVDRQNLRIEARWNDADAERAGVFASELVALAPDAIMAASTTNLVALLRATRTIPVVCANVFPVVQGFVSSLAHPGSNVTGFAAYEFSFGGKWLYLLKQLAPNLQRVAVMFNPETSPQSKFFLPSIRAAARSLDVQVITAPVHEIGEIESVIVGLSHQPNGGLIFPVDSFTGLHNELIIELVARDRVPAIYSNQRSTAKEGGLMYYAADFVEQYRQAATYIDRILKGEKPRDLRVQLPTKYELVINRKTAKLLGLSVPLTLLSSADEVIE